VISTDSPNLKPAAPKKSRRRWPFIIAGLLTVHTGAMITAVVIASRDPGFSVDPAYYQKAVHWDESQAIRHQSDKLGWQATIQPSSIAEGGGTRTTSFSLTDSNHQAIPGVAMEVTYFHHAHGRDVRTAKLATTDAGDSRRFTTQLDMPWPGTWEFELTARAGEKLFVKRELIEVK
jgi:hypothetical protein